MRSERRRKKKLIVAFHFQFSNRAGWDCETCRKNGLEVKRRCGYLPASARGKEGIVWGRRQVQSEECPTSFITPESIGFIEQFFVGRRLGIAESSETAARTVDAFLILNDQLEREKNDGTSQH